METWALQLTGKRSCVLALIGIAVVLGLSPGPARLYVVAHALRDGRRSGVVAAIGLCVGTILSCLISSLTGISSLLTQPGLALVFHKVAAAYLLFLAVMLARRRSNRNVDASVETKRGGMIFVGGCLLNVFNPYQYSFYLLVVPSVISSVGGALDRAAILKSGVIYLSVVSVIYMTLALSAGWVGRFSVQRPGIARRLVAVPAVALAIMAVSLGFGDWLR